MRHLMELIYWLDIMDSSKAHYYALSYCIVVFLLSLKVKMTLNNKRSRWTYEEQKTKIQNKT